MHQRVPPNLSHPGELIREEVEGRGWSLSDLAKIIGRPLQVVSAIVNGKKTITLTTASQLGEAFGTGPELWLNLQSMWELSHAQKPDGKIRERAAFYQLAPVQEMERRKWIRKTNSPDALSGELAHHFGVRNLGELPDLAAAARAAVSGVNETLTSEQWAWCCRCCHVSSLVHTKPFRQSALKDCVPELRRLAEEPEEIRHVPKILADAGVRLVIVEHLKRTRIDGAALRRSASQPIVALSLRYGRIDNFWHTLMHEIAHILNRDGIRADSEIQGEGENIDAIENRANKMATEWLIPEEDMSSFIRRTTMAYTARKITNFARRIGVHPAIVAGQLKFRKELRWDQFTKLNVDVRNLVRQSNISDGWGEPAPMG